MFARVATVFTFFFFVLPFLASASAVPRTDTPAPIPASQCNTGDIKCCNQVQAADSSGVNVLAALLGIVLGPVQGLVGINCSPLSIIGIGGNSCTAQPVCCTGNTFGGLLTVGCSPINVNL